jgi:molecular chaperone HtpG
MNNETKKGGISVQTEHIFPVIKKWLYSEKDIFLREIVSNACDAITKLRRLDSLGEISLPEERLNSFRVEVTLDKEEGTLSVSDNGIGMTEEELKKYLCNIALSGALDFIAKYEGENESESGIIGHFGLGFYSSFMVSNTVEVITKSYTDSPAVKWTCGEDGEYEIESYDTDVVGTTVVMHISDAEKEYVVDFEEQVEQNNPDGYSVVNDKVDLVKIVDDRIILSLLINFLCKDDCKGICPSCGANLNQEECKCKK